MTFDEKVYSDANAASVLTKEAFSLSIAGGSATLDSSTPTDITTTDNTTFMLTMNLNGTINNEEVVTVVPSSATAIFDDFGNAALTTNNNTVRLSWGPTSKTELQTALAAWIADQSAATTTYGDISTWNVTAVKDFSSYLIYLGIGLVIWNSICSSISSAPILFTNNRSNIQK